MFLSNAFKKDILSNNTEIVPVVVIEKPIDRYQVEPEYDEPYLQDVVEWYGFSTKSIELYYSQPLAGVTKPMVACKPLLLSIPKVKEGVDLFSGKIKSTSITITLSNAEYGNKRISDTLFTQSNMLNAYVSVYLCSPSCRTISPQGGGTVSASVSQYDCPLLYSGKIRNLSHSNENITINLEDIVQQKIHKELPAVSMPDSHTVPDKYKNAPIPMVFGHMRNTPLVAKWRDGNLNFIIDNKEIESINEGNFYDNVSNGPDTDAFTGFPYNAIRTFNKKYIGLVRNIEKKFVTESTIDGQVNPEYVPISVGTPQYVLNDDNTISLLGNSLLRGGRVQGIYEGPPEDVILARTGDSNDNVYGENLLSEDDVRNLTDENPGSSVSLTDTVVGTVLTVDAWENYTDIVAPYILRMNTQVSSADYQHLLKLAIEDFNLPLLGDADFPQGFGLWDENRPFILAGPLGSETSDLIYGNIEHEFIYDDVPLLATFNNGSPYGNGGSIEEVDRIEYDPSTAGYYMLPDLFTQSANHGLNQDNTNSGWNLTMLNNVGIFRIVWNANAPIRFKTRYNQDLTDAYTSTNVTMDCIPTYRFSMGKYSWGNATPEDWYSIDFLGAGISNWTNNYEANYFDFILQLVNLQDIKLASLVEYKDASNLEYYADVKGRVDYDLDNEYLQNPIDIIRHIVEKELGVVEWDYDEFNEARDAHDGWEFAFAITERINSKKLLQDISQSTMSYPRVRADRRFGFVTIKRMYLQEDYEDAITINNNEIIKYNFKLTPPDKLINKLSIEYGYDHAIGKYLSKFDSIQYGEDAIYITQAWESLNRFNGLDDSDNEVIFKTKYIQDKTTAGELKTFKFLNQQTQHLVVELELPLIYSEIDTGTLIKFEKDTLIDNMKAYGIDYTNPNGYGGTVRYPLFLVQDVQRSLNSIKIKAMQLHYLKYHGHLFGTMVPDNNSYNSFDDDNFFDSDHFPNIDLTNDPVFEDIYEGTDEWYDESEFYEWEWVNQFLIEGLTTSPTSYFNIGANSEFQTNDGTNFESSYLRNFVITEDDGMDAGVLIEDGSGSLAYNLRDNIDFIFSKQNWGVTEWEDLLPPKNEDNSGYGDILNGPYTDNTKVGGFIAIEIRIQQYYSGSSNDRKILALRNIKDTEFDEESDVFGNVMNTQLNLASQTEIKLGWVMYRTISYQDWDYGNIKNAGNSPSTNLNFTLYPGHNPNGFTNFPYQKMAVFTARLYPYFNPIPGLNLSYNSQVETELLPDTPPVMGSNYADNLDITYIVQLAYVIMENGYLEMFDTNQDGTVDIFDIILAMNLILNNTNQGPKVLSKSSGPTEARRSIGGYN